VTSAQVLYECLPDDNHPRAALAFEAAHRSPPGLEAAVIALNRIVGVPLHVMLRRPHPNFDHAYIGMGAVGDNLNRLGLGDSDRGVEDAPAALASRRADR
jgi:hypothetical protein